MSDSATAPSSWAQSHVSCALTLATKYGWELYRRFRAVQALAARGEVTDYAVEFSHVSYRYPRAKRWALDDIDLLVRENSLSVLTGPTGSGKSTLLKLVRGLHKEYGGEFRGNLSVSGKNMSGISISQLGSKVAIIFQNPAYQLHQPRVIDEIMSAPIYQGLPWEECLERAKESADEVLSRGFLERNPVDLSTGEQQKVALAASLAMKADVLVMDEPFAYLDTRAASDFLEVVARLKAHGKTVILATHHLEPVAPLADDILLMDKGRLVLNGPPRHVLYSDELHDILGRPVLVEVAARLLEERCLDERPVSWHQLLDRFDHVLDREAGSAARSVASVSYGDPVIELTDVSYSYPNGQAAVRDISLAVEQGEILGIVGSNGSGKTTLAKLMLGILKPSDGHVLVFGRRGQRLTDIASRVGYVTQNPSQMLFETTVWKECIFGPKSLDIPDPELRVEDTLSKLGLLEYADRDPHSLSGGEQRLLSLADVLVNDPEVLILDEPEFGLDLKRFRAILETIRGLRDEGRTFVMITQDIETAVFICDRIALVRDGRILRTAGAAEICGDRELLQSAGLKYLPLLATVEYVVRETGRLVNEQMFADKLVSLWSRQGPSV